MTAYHPHEAFIAPARRMSALPLTLIGFALIELAYAAGREALDALAFDLAPPTVGEVLRREGPVGVLYDLFSFALLGIAVAGVVRLLHHRDARSLLGPSRLMRRDLLRAGTGAVALFLLLELVLPWWDHAAAVMRPLSIWLPLLPLAVLALLVQVAAEEMFYRGYFQQQIAARFASPAVWLVVPNIAFASVHWYNGADTAESLQYVVWAFAFGLAASDLTARTGALGAAIGFHLANNIFAFLVAGEAGTLDNGLALFLLPPSGEGGPFPDPEPLVSLAFGLDLMVLGLAWLAVRVAIRR